jgi:hypothetical protein
MKKFAAYALGLLLAIGLFKSCMADPNGSAKKVNEAADAATQAGSSFSTFFFALGGGTLLLIAIGVAAYILSKRK